MEYIDEIVNIIGSLGFPIAMCLAMFNYMKTNNKELTAAVTDLSKCVTELKDLINILINKA